MVFTYIIFATLIVSAISLVGVLTLFIKKDLLDKLLLSMVALAAGVLLGGGFLHLLPEAVEPLGEAAFIYTIGGLVLFFCLERVLQWRHCHDGVCDVHVFTYMSLFGDAAHNFIDGLIIAASFLTSVNIGITTTLAVIFHEIPQEIGDFAILVYGGFSRKKALFYNFISALTAVAGAVTGYFLSTAVSGFQVALLPFAAGGFIYIAMSDLIPELHKEADRKKSFVALILFLLGIGLMWGMKIYLGG